MVKQTIFIPLTFNQTPTVNTFVQVSFPVKTIHVKSAAYEAQYTGKTDYVVIKSDIVDNSPLCIVYQDSTYSATTIIDVETTFTNPKIIQGMYTFTLFNMDNTIGSVSSTAGPILGVDKVGIILEFNSPEEYM